MEGALELNQARIPFPLYLVGSSFAGSIRLAGAHLDTLSLQGSHTGAIFADSLKAEGAVFLRRGFRSEGEVRLVGAWIGSLDCEGGQFVNPEGSALAADGLKSEGAIFLRRCFAAKGEVSLSGACIGGDLDCDGGNFLNPNRKALNADTMKVEGNVLLRSGFWAAGEVRLMSATIGGNLQCDGTLANSNDCALTADGLKVEGSVSLQKGFVAEGEVRFVRAVIGGNLECEGAKFLNGPHGDQKPDRCALNAEGVRVRGDLALSRGFSAEGEVRLMSASIGGNVDCEGGKFLNPPREGAQHQRYALNGDGLNVEGAVFLRLGFRAEGRVSFVAASVRLHFQWRGLLEPEKAILDLRSAKIGTLWDDEASWPQKGNLLLHGAVYTDICDEAPSDVAKRLGWLRRQPQREGQFFPQPYEQLAGVLRKQGHDEDAREVMIAKNKDRAKLAHMGRLERHGHRILGLAIGYGYRPWRAFWWSVFFVALGTVVFWSAYGTGTMRPTVHGEGQLAGFNPLVYSVDVFLPIVDLHQEGAWLPDATASFGCLVWGYMWLHIALGWVLTSLWVAGLSGLVKR